MDIVEKVAIVTGGSSGLGQCVVEELLKHKAKVAIFDLSKPPQALTHENVVFKSVDVTDEGSVSQAIESVKSLWGEINICVNCAGIAPAKRMLNREGEASKLDIFSKVVQINLIGTFNVMKAAASAMADNAQDEDSSERGIIINTASIAGYEGQIGQSAYAASKGGVIAMTLPLARELSSIGIRVNTIAPGTMGTPMLLSMPDNVQDALVSNIQFPKRLGHTSEFSALARHIIENAYINGETIRLDGALRMPPK